MQLNFKSIHLFGHFTSLCPAIHSPPLSPRHSYPWRQKILVWSHLEAKPVTTIVKPKVFRSSA